MEVRYKSAQTHIKRNLHLCTEVTQGVHNTCAWAAGESLSQSVETITKFRDGSRRRWKKDPGADEAQLLLELSTKVAEIYKKAHNA